MLKRKQLSEWIQQTVFVGPGLLFFTLIVILPFFMGFYYTFTSWDGMDMDHAKWVGLDNLKRIFTEDDRFWSAFWFTSKFTVAAVAVTNLVSFVLAMLLTQNLKLKGVLRTIFFLPNVIGGLLLGYIWYFIFVRGFSTIGEATGIGFFNLQWLGTPATGFWGIVIVFVWQTAGYMMLIYIAAILNVPKELMEAARIDGAGAWRILRSVTLPLIMPAITICLFLTTSNAFKMFDLNLSLTGGGPGNATESIALNIYREGLVNGRYGLGTAKAMIFFFGVALITLTQVWVTKKKEVEA
ncbi:raffinose/stachyose/melibiose transport system permease protein [Paenibacillus phyllosphaerae]|uniref:Raffinose/stachyose/melibiose transport system permease protein n=1 Tax=Paenibacillus phyllosphaerae TaxID=274593 RepID=A0A7W5FN68_9BACL|nr:sugar ABC transporter permease [Paenibacillus phyllosphaerae]MBB3110729.1 raffinose/stachyose/melibiose transport system permease protein [Paenibacillus phyllosphaerae]